MSNPSWFLAGVSIEGAAHDAVGRPCEDANYHGTNGVGAFVIVACDGAGSRRFSGQGAAAVAPTVGKFLLQNASDVMARRIRPATVLDVARSSLAEIAGPRSLLDEFACTLVALLIEGNRAMTCHVGDGAILMLEAEIPRCVSRPDGDPDGGSGTTFVTCRHAAPRMWEFAIPDWTTGFLAVTDGAQSTLYNTITGATSPLATQLMNRFDFADNREERERALRECVVSRLKICSEDDITVVGARRAYVAGTYGCPICKRSTVQLRKNVLNTLVFGYCTVCHRQVFAHDENLEEVWDRYRRTLPIATAEEFPIAAGLRLESRRPA